MSSKYDIDYSDLLEELSQVNPLCATIPSQLMHCLNPDHLRLAVLLQTHREPRKIPAFQIGFISDGEPPIIETNFGNIEFSGNRASTCITYRLNGIWVLKIEGQPYELSLGQGELTVDAFDAKTLAHPGRANMLGPNQIGFIWLMNRSVEEPGFPNARVEVEAIQFATFLQTAKPGNVLAWFVMLTACAPGFNRELEQLKVFGQIFSLGFSHCAFTNRMDGMISPQGGEKFILEIVGVPDNKMQLVKYLNARLGLPVSEITANLTEKGDTHWIIYAGENLGEVVALHGDLTKLGASARVTLPK